jgi:peroxiredoxin
LLSDTGNKVAKTFGLAYTLPDDLRQLYLKFGIDLEKYNGDETWTLPIPARYLIDQTGTIRYVKADPDYTVRPEPEDTLAALKEITQ